MKRSLLLTFLANLFCGTLLYGQSGTCGPNLSWSLENGQLTISGTGKMYDYNSNNQPYYLYKDAIKSVYFTDEVTYIGRCAFYELEQLKEIRWPAKLEEIADHAFGFTGFESINIPNSVKHIHNDAFECCQNLTSISIGEGLEIIEGETIIGCHQFHSVEWNAINCSVQSWHYTNPVFPLYGQITSITLGEKVERIPKHLFSDCNISSLILPSSLKIIESEAFTNCSSLKKLVIPSSVEAIEGNAFAFSGLTELIILSNKLKEQNNLANEAFYLLPIESVYVADYEGYLNSSTGFNRRIIKPMVKFSSSEFKYNGQPPIVQCTSNIPEYSIEATFPTLESSVGSYSIMVPVTFIGEQQFSVDFPYSYTILPAALDLSWEQNLNGLKVGDIIELTAETTSGLPIKYIMDSNEYADIYVIDGKTYLECKAVGTFNIKAVLDNNSASSPSVEKEVSIISEADDEIALSIIQADNGFIKLHVAKGEQISLAIVANEGWKIHSVSYNEDDVTDQIDADGNYTTPSITGNATLNVVYEMDTETAVTTPYSSMVKIQALDFGVRVQNAKVGDIVQVYNVDGTLQKSMRIQNPLTEIPLAKDNVYIIKVSEKIVKVKI